MLEERIKLLLESYYDYKFYLLNDTKTNEIYRLIKLRETDEKIQLLQHLMEV